ncbi:hypothetical protein [Geodermatophilus poikilotrophus]|nr:hypothetical protein [Geodermatophilus poikilotrophus]
MRRHAAAPLIHRGPPAPATVLGLLAGLAMPGVPPLGDVFA